MAPRGTRKNALLATWTRGRLARVASAPRRDGAVSIPAPHPSLPAAVVAARPTSITDAISAATSSQPPAMTSRRSPCGSPLAWRPFPDRLPRGERSPDLSAPRILAVTGPELSRTRNGGPEGRNGPAFRLPVLRATECRRSLAPGGRRAEHSALRPPGPFRLDSGTPCLVAVGAHTTEERQNGPDGVQLSGRASRSRLPVAAVILDARMPATGGKGVPTDGLIEVVADEQYLFRGASATASTTVDRG